MPIKDPVKRKEYKRLWYLKNKERINEKMRLYDHKNKEHIKEYRQSQQGKKAGRISNWKQRGILCFDYNLLYDIFVKTTHCEFCNCILTAGRYTTSTTRCLDHNHNITDRFNIRGVLCNSCNIKDVLKD
tara:strand:+ start:207 stop:593 length:387 start_codon:yes stop_codon:yes gene_type:complete